MQNRELKIERWNLTIFRPVEFHGKRTIKCELHAQEFSVKSTLLVISLVNVNLAGKFSFFRQNSTVWSATVWKSRQKHDHHFYGKIAILTIFTNSQEGSNFLYCPGGFTKYFTTRAIMILLSKLLPMGSNFYYCPGGIFYVKSHAPLTY